MIRLMLIMLGTSLLWACSGAQDFSNMGVGSIVTDFEVKTFNQLDQTPGVYSKLRKVRDYRLLFKGKFLQDTRVIGLHIDSVLVPLNLIGEDGKTMESKTIAKGEEREMLFKGNRLFYNAEAPDRGMEIQIYQSMPQTLNKNSACLYVECKGEFFCIDLGEIEILPAILAP